ncbi:hypothetical protein MPTK1_2g25450 [Marchantia polymorpha subsp. ruderalis]
MDRKFSDFEGSRACRYAHSPLHHKLHLTESLKSACSSNKETSSPKNRTGYKRQKANTPLPLRAMMVRIPNERTQMHIVPRRSSRGQSPGQNELFGRHHAPHSHSLWKNMTIARLLMTRCSSLFSSICPWFRACSSLNTLAALRHLLLWRAGQSSHTQGAEHRELSSPDTEPYDWEKAVLLESL